MHLLDLICYLIAAVCFAVAAFFVTPSPNSAAARINLVALGLLAWVIVPLAHTIH